jgi:hypothetical protein
MARFNMDKVSGATKYFESEMKRLADSQYNYRNVMRHDILDAIENVLYDDGSIAEASDRDELCEALNDILWDADTVTGNGSGSYTFSRDEARKCVADNLDIMVEMATEFDCKDKLLEHLMDSDFEWIDVSIRCYLLNDMIYDTLVYLDRLNAISYDADEE